MSSPVQIPQPINTTDFSNINDLGSMGSVQLMFAKLQLEQSNLSKDRATEYMGKIKDIQALQKECAKWISEARKYKLQVEAGGKAEMPADMKAFFDKYKLVAGKNDKDGWQASLTSLTNFQESVGNETQTHMVYLQDFIGQYNSFLQGANSAVAAANQVMTTIARGQ